MSKASHTPGPWRFDEEHNEIVGRPEWGCIRFRVKGEWSVASVETDCGSDAEVEANARLIAAAPELLDALRSAVGAMEVLDHPKGYGALLKAQNAIAKAEGRHDV